MLDLHQPRFDRVLRDVLRAEALDVAKPQRLRDQRFEDVVAVVVVASSGDARKETNLGHLVDFADGQHLLIDDGRDAVEGRGARGRGQNERWQRRSHQ